MFYEEFWKINSQFMYFRTLKARAKHVFLTVMFGSHLSLWIFTHQSVNCFIWILELMRLPYFLGWISLGSYMSLQINPIGKKGNLEYFCRWKFISVNTHVHHTMWWKTKSKQCPHEVLQSHDTRVLSSIVWIVWISYPLFFFFF